MFDLLLSLRHGYQVQTEEQLPEKRVVYKYAHGRQFVPLDSVQQEVSGQRNISLDRAEDAGTVGVTFFVNLRLAARFDSRTKTRPLL